MCEEARDSGWASSYKGRKLGAKDALGFRAARVRGHGGLAHAQHFEANVFSFSIAVQPKTNDMSATGCDGQ
jgi:hypothetical protein